LQASAASHPEILQSPNQVRSRKSIPGQPLRPCSRPTTSSCLRNQCKSALYYIFRDGPKHIKPLWRLHFACKLSFESDLRNYRIRGTCCEHCVIHLVYIRLGRRSSAMLKNERTKPIVLKI